MAPCNKAFHDEQKTPPNPGETRLGLPGSPSLSVQPLSAGQHLPGLPVLERGETCCSSQHADNNQKGFSSRGFKIKDDDASSCLLRTGTSSCTSAGVLSSEGWSGARLCPSSLPLNPTCEVSGPGELFLALHSGSPPAPAKAASVSWWQPLTQPLFTACGQSTCTLSDFEREGWVSHSTSEAVCITVSWWVLREDNRRYSAGL